MSAEDIEYMGDYKKFPTKESVLDWLDNYLSLDERNNLIKVLEQEPKWIPINKDDFPKTEEQYAFITVYNQTKMCWYQNGVFVDSEQNAYTKENEELVAWMPFQIPKPYKSESEE